MSKFYLDTDLRNNLFYIAPFQTPESGHYIIRFEQRYKADEFLKKLIAGLSKSPDQDEGAYELIEVLEEGRGKVFVYRAK